MSASYPGSAADDVKLSIAVNSLQSTLSTSMDSVVTSVVMASATGFPTAGYVTIDNEVVRYLGISGSTLTSCTRGADGTTAAAHNSGVPVSATIVAAHHNDNKNEIEAVETDLVAAFGSISPSAANAVDTNMANRIKSLAYQIKSGFGLTNWYDTISATFLKADLSNIGTVANNLPMNGHKITGLAAGTANGDALRYEQLFTSGTVTLLGPLDLGSNKITGVAAGTAATDAANVGQLNNTFANLLDNGGFEIWQRGTSFTASANSIYTADRWQVGTNEATNVTVTKETTTIDSVGLASMEVVVTSAGASKFWSVSETIEDCADYRGKTVTASVGVFSSVASAIRVKIEDNVSSAISSYHTGGGGWETLTVSYTVNVAATLLDVQVGMITAGDKKNGTYYFDSAMVVEGSEAVAFNGTNPEIDLARCQRYYEIGTISGVNLPIVNVTSIRTEIDSFATFRVTKRVAPTMTMTTTQSTQIQLAPGAFGTVGDSPSLWVSSGSGAVDGFSFTANRGSNSTYPTLQYSATWTASADL